MAIFEICLPSWEGAALESILAWQELSIANKKDRTVG